jgi:hypothetical protein
MKMYGRGDVQPQAFLTLALEAGEWSVSHPGRFTLRETPSCPSERNLVGLQSQCRCRGEENFPCLESDADSLGVHTVA